MPPKRFPKRESTARQPPIARPPQVATPSNNDEAAGTSTAGSPDDDAQQRYEEELAWCIHRLKASLFVKNFTPKQASEIRKTISILENPNELITKKRCIMKTSLGDYRQNMEAEKRKISLGLHNAKISTGTSNSSGQFMRKSSQLASSAGAERTSSNNFVFQPSENTFRFNFSTNDNDIGNK